MQTTNTATFSYVCANVSAATAAAQSLTIYDINPSDYISIEKTSDIRDVVTGSVVEFTITIVITDLPVALTSQRLVDTWDTEKMELVAGSTKLDGVVTDIDFSGYTTTFEANSTHTITYQCKIL